MSDYLLKRREQKLASPTGSVMTVEEARKYFANVKVGANNMEGKFQSGNYECSKGTVYFRSKWEANISLYLDWLIKQKEIKDWEYETEIYRFEGLTKGSTTYRIDFKVWLNDKVFEIWEVKGFMTPQAKTKLKRMKKYFPDVKVVLVDGKAYGEIVKRMKSLITFY